MNNLVFLALMLVVFIVIGPFLTIWSLNTLFPSLAIPYGLSTWAAVILLGTALRANVSVNK